ncbi:hypothetical protein RJD24_06570 [Bacillaceae bacterium IKA-2]|nr:hypothetical protein RJD24_06570 [Bacillaceae bacterium IKA-2]
MKDANQGGQRTEKIAEQFIKLTWGDPHTFDQEMLAVNYFRMIVEGE